jgi:hypothetical protein
LYGIATAVAWIGGGLLAPAALAINNLEIGLERKDVGGAFEYTIWFSSNKDGAGGGTLQTPAGTYVLGPWDGDWIPAPQFWLDHQGLTFAEMQTRIGTNWVLTWDPGLATETVAQIGFGPVTAGEFPATPVIAQPADGATGIAPDASLVWNYGAADPCNPAPDEIQACVAQPTPEQCAEMGSCTDVTWTPPIPMLPGTTTMAVMVRLDIRDVADGIGGPITGDPWVLGNLEWLAVEAIDISTFEVAPSAVESLGFGRIKALYR